MAKTHKRLLRPGRFFESDLPETWFTFVQEMLADLKAAIAKRGISQDELSTILGKDPALISRTLSGRNNMTLLTLCEIALAIGCRPEIHFKDLRKTAKADHRAVKQAAPRRPKKREASGTP